MASSRNKKKSKADRIKALPKYKDGGTKRDASTREGAEYLYKTVAPSGYSDLGNYVRYFTGTERSTYLDPRSEETYKQYLGINDQPSYLDTSSYIPSQGGDSTSTYYKMDPEFDKTVLDYYKQHETEFVPGRNKVIGEWEAPTETSGYNEWSALGNFTIGEGADEKGRYVSYYDKYDLPDYIQDKMKGNPYEIYNRIYLPKAESSSEKFKRELLESKKKKNGGWLDGL